MTRKWAIVIAVASSIACIHIFLALYFVHLAQALGVSVEPPSVWHYFWLIISSFVIITFSLCLLVFPEEFREAWNSFEISTDADAEDVSSDIMQEMYDKKIL